MRSFVQSRTLIVAIIPVALVLACGKRSGLDRGDANQSAIAQSGDQDEATTYPQAPRYDASESAKSGNFAAAPEQEASDAYEGRGTSERAAPSSSPNRGRAARAANAESTSPAAAPAKSSGQELATRGDASGARSKQGDSFQPKEERPGLGTTWGETRTSRVETVDFERAQAGRPSDVLRIYYNDERGIAAQTGMRSLSTLEPNSTSGYGGFISVEIVDPQGTALPGLWQSGRSYVVGHDGDRYAIRIQNHERIRVEIVASVDGLDVIDGTSSSYQKRGYVLAPYATLLIEGFRRSTSAVASFRFGSVAESYAARTGTDRHVGVIGVALFEERGYRRDPYTTHEIMRRETADPFPGEFAQPPRSLPR
ncbi:MAG TPA: hypothetical protein VIV60_06415 [Polyangiaceae bacterium]